MRVPRQRVTTVVRAIIHEIRVEGIPFMAGSIAYHAFVSLLPLLFLLLAVVSTIGNKQLEASLIEAVQAAVTPGAGQVLVAELKQTSTGASVLGVAALVWGMLRIFRNLDAAFSDIYETQSRNSFADQLVDGITVFLSMAGLILLAVVGESQLSFGTSAVGLAAHRLFVVGLVGTALLPMYYVFPDEPEMHIAEAVPGVVFTATALVTLESGFRLYIQHSSETAQNGVLASILVFLTWLYVSGFVILVGAAINAVLSNRSEDVSIRPVIGGKAITTEAGDDPPDAALNELQNRLPAASEVTIVVDEKSITLPVPKRVETETTTSVIDDTVGIELQWRREED